MKTILALGLVASLLACGAADAQTRHPLKPPRRAPDSSLAQYNLAMGGGKRGRGAADPMAGFSALGGQTLRTDGAPAGGRGGHRRGGGGFGSASLGGASLGGASLGGAGAGGSNLGGSSLGGASLGGPSLGGGDLGGMSGHHGGGGHHRR